MPGPVTSNFSAQLFKPDLWRAFIEVGKERPAEADMLFNILDMPWNPAKDFQYSGMGSFQPKPEGEQFVLDRPIEGGSVTYTAVAWALGFEVAFENWDDDLYQYWPEMAAELGRAGRNRYEVQAWDLLNSAFSTTRVGFDGTQLCSTTHTGLDGVVRANRPTPDVALSITGLQSMILRYEGMTDERNLPRLLAPAMIVIHAANKFTAREILGSQGKPFTPNNEINSLIAEDQAVFIGHYLTSQTAWWGIARKGDHDLNVLWKNRPMFDSFDDPRTKTAVFTGYERFAIGFSSYRGVDGTTGV